MTLAGDVVADGGVVAVAGLLAVDVEGAGRAGVGTDVSCPAHGAVTLASHWVTVALGQESLSAPGLRQLDKIKVPPN